jgi:hypothetical protein
MILSRIELILPIQLEEKRSIYLIQSSSSLPTCAASLAHIVLVLGYIVPSAICSIYSYIDYYFDYIS